MLNDAIKKAIDLACSVELRDFTLEEKQYILNCSNASDCGKSSLRENLLFWFESMVSDGCWTEDNVTFMNSLYKVKTFTTTDGYVFTQQPDGTWVSLTGDVSDYPPDHQHFCHVETGEVVLLPPGEYIASDRLKAFGILTEATFIFQGEQFTYEQLAERGWMECACDPGYLGMPPREKTQTLWTREPTPKNGKPLYTTIN